MKLVTMFIILLFITDFAGVQTLKLRQSHGATHKNQREGWFHKLTQHHDYSVYNYGTNEFDEWVS